MIFTEIAGGTDGALSSGLAPPVPEAEMGMTRFAFLAAGCAGDDSKNVADTVAMNIKSSEELLPLSITDTYSRTVHLNRFLTNYQVQR